MYLTSLIMRLPSLVILNLFPVSSSFPWYHFTIGLGAPKVSHVKVTSEPVTVLNSFSGGVVISGGSASTLTNMSL